MTEETTFWKGSPSQWLNIGPFSVAILLAAGITVGGVFFAPAFIALIIPAAYALWRYLTVRCQTFEVTTERLRITKGVINQNIDEVELYRVKDMVVERKWWMRLTGLGNVHLQTSDRSLPHVDIPAITDCIGLREELRKLVEAMRDKKRVREMDFDETGGENGFDDIDDMGDIG
ncbi:MAG: PH domain-containing protein [Luteolibacter sp.]